MHTSVYSFPHSLAVQTVLRTKRPLAWALYMNTLYPSVIRVGLSLSGVLDGR